MKTTLEKLIRSALIKLEQASNLAELPPMIQIDACKDKNHGDYASNIAMVLAKTLKQKPRDLAQRIIDALPPSEAIEKVEIAGPGFINFFMVPQAFNQTIAIIHRDQERFGHSEIGRGKSVLVEFLSSNPTGPLHVGHGRLAAFGAVVANLLAAIGFKPYSEYYVNDAGRQMDIVTVSVWMRYLNLSGTKIAFPANAYQGDYILDIARQLQTIHSQHLVRSADTIIQGLPQDVAAGGDKEKYIDALIERTKILLGDDYAIVFDMSLKLIMADIKDDLAHFGVHYDNWFSERDFVATGEIDTLLEALKTSGHTYHHDGALWFRSTDYGDSKDRVLVRSNGQRTYFANDVGYHLNKFARGFDMALDIFGSDHHGYTPRMKAAMEASGIDPERLLNLLIQFVNLYRGAEPVSMSTRAGNFITLRELRDEVGNDAARFFYVARKAEQHVDFDLELAKKKSNENPVFYVQYAHARICSVFKQLKEQALKFDIDQGIANLMLLNSDHEKTLLNTLNRYPDVLRNAALNYEPHILTNYLRELAADFHALYNSKQFIVPDAPLRNARLALISATRIVLRNGFKLIGISAPESM